MTENKLVAALIKNLRMQLPSFTIFKHNDRVRHGIPDISVTGRRLTTWLEVKYADPEFDSPGIQELTLKRLAATSMARYLIYAEPGRVHTIRKTCFVLPAQIGQWKDVRDSLNADAISTNGFDHDWVVDVIRRVHAGELTW